MPQNQVRLSTLAEIKVLSLESIKNFGGAEDLSGALATLKQKISGDGVTTTSSLLGTAESLFQTVGIAREIRVTEDYASQNLYAIGSPTRPRIVPGNFSATVTCQRLQLDKRNLYDFMSTPEYFYSRGIQAATGILDSLYYTYMFIRNKEEPGTVQSHDIYALMPRSSTKTLTNGDVMISHNVELTGFKINYGEDTLRGYLRDVIDDITYTVPGRVSNQELLAQQLEAQQGG